MRMNRRNVLIGMGAIVAGGGAALGTGAFSSVEATRDVTIDTSSDTEAYVNLEGVEEEYVDESGDQLVIDLDDLNENAVTRIDSIVEVSVGGSAPEGVAIDSVSAEIVDDTDGLEIIDDNAESDPYEIGLEVDLEEHDPDGGDIEITVETSD